MRTKKILSAVLAVSLTATSMLGSAMLQASAADQKILTFDLRSEGKNEVKISADQIAEGDFTVPVDIYIPENPGVNGINLKLQVNDGQVDENGNFGNYGLYLNDGTLAAPFCFDSAAKGDAAGSVSQTFNSKDMNVSWLYSLDCKKNADAAVQADTTAWDSSAEWAYTNPFATANLVIPKDTPAGTYRFDIRKDQYINARSAEAGMAVKSMSSCIGAESDSALEFKSVPLTVTVGAVSAKWEDSYQIENGGHYLIIGDVCGKPGETVTVPVYVFGDTGTAGAQLFFNYDSRLTLDRIAQPKESPAYNHISPQHKDESIPATYTFATTKNMIAENGNVLANLNFTIPTNAKNGDLYDIQFYGDQKEYNLKIVDYEGEMLPVTFYNGSVSVLTSDDTALNRSAVSLTDAGQTANLTLFNASGEVTWKSSDTSVATVDQNGFVKTVGKGTATITASNNGKDYTATVKVGGLFGDVNQNGEISSDDAQLALSHYVECMAGNPSPLTDAQIAIADVSGDGESDITDAQLILNYYVDKIVSDITSVTWRSITNNPNAPADY